jgi:hypothetical protein
LSQGLEVTQMTDAMFGHNPMLSKRCVVGFIFRRTWLATRLPPGLGGHAFDLARSPALWDRFC